MRIIKGKRTYFIAYHYIGHGQGSEAHIGNKIIEVHPLEWIKYETELLPHEGRYVLLWWAEIAPGDIPDGFE